MIGNGLTAKDARERWGEPNRNADNEVECACPWCAVWLRDEGKSEAPFLTVVECKNLMCPLLPTGGCYWEPFPGGWTFENQRIWDQKNERKNEKEIGHAS